MTIEELEQRKRTLGKQRQVFGQAVDITEGLLDRVFELEKSPWVRNMPESRPPVGKRVLAKRPIALDDMATVDVFDGSGWENVNGHRDLPADYYTHWMLIPETPKEPPASSWRDAIGASPSQPGEMSSEEAIRRGRDTWSKNVPSPKRWGENPKPTGRRPPPPPAPPPKK
jgi:hypothetical protein